MARLARVVVPGRPHHVIQRGNRRQTVFFNDSHKKAYLQILGLQSKLFGLQVWAYCLMSNHVHLIVVPKYSESLVKAIGETHALYTRMINFEKGWSGYLWQGRFKSVVMDERYLFTAVRYVELNPVRAGLVRQAEDYPFSSARAHITKIKDELLAPFYLQDEICDWKAYLTEIPQEEEVVALRKCGETGRPIGNEIFLSDLEKETDRILIKQRPGPRK